MTFGPKGMDNQKCHFCQEGFSRRLFFRNAERSFPDELGKEQDIKDYVKEELTRI